MKANKKTKFFCENCGSEVPENARMCKKCGKFFISVRCPKCGATGTNDDFASGCPKCGYAMKGTNASPLSIIHSESSADNKSKHDIFLGKNRKSHSYSEKTSKETSLPLWVYIFTASTFLVVLCIVYGCIK